MVTKHKEQKVAKTQSKVNINFNEELASSSHEVDNLDNYYGAHTSSTHSLVSECSQHSQAAAWHTCAKKAMSREMSRALSMHWLVLKSLCSDGGAEVASSACTVTNLLESVLCIPHVLKGPWSSSAYADGRKKKRKRKPQLGARLARRPVQGHASARSPRAPQHPGFEVLPPRPSASGSGSRSLRRNAINARARGCEV